MPLEVEFWAQYLRTSGGEFADEYRARVDPDAELTDPMILAAIDQTATSVRILDVGAGPLTVLGKRDPRNSRRTLEIVAVDPLAHDYDRLLEECGITPPVRTEQCRGEEVAKRFGADAFDIGYARNSIDHSAEPMAVIESMVETVRPGGTIVLHHYRREGQRERYEQLHQWNFDVRDTRLIVWGRRASYDITQRLSGEAHVAARVTQGAGEEWVEAAIKVSPKCGPSSDGGTG